MAGEQRVEDRQSDGSDPATGGMATTEDTEATPSLLGRSREAIPTPSTSRPNPSDEAAGGNAETLKHSTSQSSLNSTKAETGALDDKAMRRGSGGGFRAFRRRSSQASAGSIGSTRAMYDRDAENGGHNLSQRSTQGDGLGKLRDRDEEPTMSGGGCTFRAPHNRKGSLLSRSSTGTENDGGRRRSSLIAPVVRFVKRVSQTNSSGDQDDGLGDSAPNWNVRRRRTSEEDETSEGRSHVSSLKSNRTSGTLGTMNFWSKLEKKQDIWDTPDYEDDGLYAFSCRDCTSALCVKTWTETKRVLLTTLRNPSILITVLVTLGVLTAAGCVTVKVLADSYENALRDDALDRAVETGNWISRELDEALLPLFTLSQFVQHLDDFKGLPHKIGMRGEDGSAPPEFGKRNMTHRNVTGICDDPNIRGPFNEIAASIKKDAKMEGVLVNVQLAPYAVVCQVYPIVNTEDFPPGISLNNTGAIGHDLLNDENRRFIARATVPAPGVVIAGPLTLIQGDTPKVKEAFIARLAINMPGYNIPLDGTDYECYGFAVIILNWEALKKKVGFDEAIKKQGMEYRLTRTDVKENAETGERTIKVATIAKSDRSEEVLTDWNTVSTELNTANNKWVMELGYEAGFRPPWEAPLTAVVVVLAFIVTCMLMVMLVMKKEMQVLLYKMMPPKIIKKLRRGQTVVNRYEASTIFFSDVVGFTTLSGSMSPVEVMKMLNDMYTAFDALVEKYGAYKVDTIGDAYIVIGGGPDNCLGREGAEKVAKFALDAIEVVKDLTAPNGAHVLIRAGLASGPVVAGVVGTTMPKFTLFGDTVNLASRMESTGIKMKIQCNDMTYRLLRDSPNYDFSFEERKDANDNKGVYVKGKGHTHTWWITGAEERKQPPPMPKAMPGGSCKDLDQDLGDLADFDCDDGRRDTSPNVSVDGGGAEDSLLEEGRLEKQSTLKGSNMAASLEPGKENGLKQGDAFDDEWNANKL